MSPESPVHPPADAQVVLASASPRRRELLAQIGVSCRVCAVDLDESALPGEAPETLALRLAAAKARAGFERAGGQLPTLGADTVVVLEGEALGKPRDVADAAAMLQRLAGREHEVLSAVALLEPRPGAPRLSSRLSRSRVAMRAISPPEARAYAATGEPLDKAGGYAIQGRAAVFIEHLSGSYSGVMGLPLFETAALLAAAGVVLVAESAAAPGSAA